MPIKLTAKQEEAWLLLNSELSELLFVGGSRSGKTFLEIYYIIKRSLHFPRSFHLIGRKHLSDIRSTILSDTFPKVCRLLNPELGACWDKYLNKAEYVIKWPNGSQIWFNGFADAKRTEKVLGSEYSTIFLNEVSQFWDYLVIEKVLTRLSQNICFNRIIYDCNPPSRAHWTYKKFMQSKDPKDGLKREFDTGYLYMNPEDNRENLPDDYIDKRLEALSGRQRARFKEGKYQNEVEGACWSCDLIEKSRADALEEYDEVVVALDPATTLTSTSDECGIIVAGRKGDRADVLNDLSAKLTPERWAQRAIDAYYAYKADVIVAEVNNGGDLIAAVIKLIDANVPVKKVHATRGKVVRSEPIVALYEKGRVKHTQIFDDLENQQTGWTPEQKTSPDRMDALVWALTYLLLERKNFFTY